MDDKQYFESIKKGLRNSSTDKLFTIAVDQSYKNSGISISVGNPYHEFKLVECMNIDGSKAKNKIEYRNIIKQAIIEMLDRNKQAMDECKYKICIVERIRQFSHGFINIDYIKSIGSLIAYISEAVDEFGIATYSVDTRCWKKTVIGTCKAESNKYNIAEEKYPTVEYLAKNKMKGFIFEEVGQEEGKKLMGRKNPKNIFLSKSGKYIKVDDDKADSICISLFAFEAMRQNKNLHEFLKRES